MDSDNGNTSLPQSLITHGLAFEPVGKFLDVSCHLSKALTTLVRIGTANDFFYSFILLVHPKGHRDAGGHIILDFRSSDNPDFGNTRPQRRNPGQNSQWVELGSSPNHTRDKCVIFYCSL